MELALTKLEQREHYGLPCATASVATFIGAPLRAGTCVPFDKEGLYEIGVAEFIDDQKVS
jgi:hypothetical protein